MYATWSSNVPGGDTIEEMILAIDRRRDNRLLVIPPLFDEANKFRQQVYQTMKLLDEQGIDVFCPDLPGCNESLRRHCDQTIGSWRTAAAAAALHIEATAVLAFRSGAWLAPAALPGWVVAPPQPAQILRGLFRSHKLAAREAGQELSGSQMLAHARSEGIVIAGWEFSPQLVCELEDNVYAPADVHRVVEQADVGGTALWLRAENDSDSDQAEALATLVASGFGLQ